jgi:hypothetical protein
MQNEELTFEEEEKDENEAQFEASAQTPQTAFSPSLLPAKPQNFDKLNNFLHRSYGNTIVETPTDIVLEATPAQRERIVFLVDDAIDTIETIVLNGKEENKLRAAQDVLDRAGLMKQQPKQQTPDALGIPAEAVVAIVNGMMGMFGNSHLSKEDLPFNRDVTPTQQQEQKSPFSSAPIPRKHTISIPESLIAQHRRKE